MNENKRKFIAGLVSGLIVFGALTFYAIETRAVNPSIVYASPSNGATFVDVWRGHGVNITVNVSDADGDLNQVVLKWNNSGTWATFYDSGALGGVSYHNVTVLNSNFTGSWTTYEYQICAYDTTWTNTTYSFTTEYVWGDIHFAYGVYNKNMINGYSYKNSTNDYYMLIINSSDRTACVLKSSNGMIYNSINYTTETISYKYAHSDLYTIDGKPTFFYPKYEFGGTQFRWRMVYLNKTTWEIVNTNIDTSAYYANYMYGKSFDIKYYNGTYYVLCGRAYDTNKVPILSLYRGNPPSFTLYADIEIASKDTTSDEDYYNYCPDLNILNGYLVLTYIRDIQNDETNISDYFYWATFDGITLTKVGAVSTTYIKSLSVTKDPVNNQLVAFYVTSDGSKIYYRVLSDPTGSWSDEHLLLSAESGYAFNSVSATYYDHRLVVTVSYNWRSGTNDIFIMFAPDYISSANGGVLKQYNRIQFPDSTPNQKHVNSSVFYFENINSRNINWINWSFSDIGSIQCENNIALWGSLDNTTWTKIGTTDANGYINMTSTTWASGLPWEAGDKRYFKIEILDVGAVPEDLHSNDESIILRVGLA